MFGSNKKSDNKTSSSSAKSSGAPKYGEKKSTGTSYGGGYSSGGATSSKYTSPYTGTSSTKLGSSTTKYTSPFTGSSSVKPTTTSDSSKYTSSYGGSSATQVSASSFGKMSIDKAAPTVSSSYKSTNFSLSTPKITDFDKKALDRRPLTTTSYASSASMFPMPSSSTHKQTTSYNDFETQLRKYNLESSPDNYSLYKSLRNELPYKSTRSYITASKLTTMVQSSNNSVMNHQTSSSYRSTPAPVNAALTSTVILSSVPAVAKSMGIKSFNDNRLKNYTNDDPFKLKPNVPKPTAPNAAEKSPFIHKPHEDKYPTKHKKGYGVIFNFENFQTGFSKRDGTNYDVQVLHDVFRRFNIYMDYGGAKNDLTLKDLQKSIKNVEKKNLSEYDCLVVVILSHGSTNNFISAYDKHFNLEDTVVGPLTRNKTIKDKPKIFIIQACRGDQRPPMQTDSTCFSLGFDARDIIKCFSTYTNQVALRDPSAGSIFIQTFCKYISEYGNKHHIVDILEKVCKEVSNQCQQTPEQTSTLTRKFYFGDLLH